MIRFLIASKVSAPTGRALAKAIAGRQGRRCFFYCRRSPSQRRAQQRGVRWGSFADTGERGLNCQLAVPQAASKLKALEIMRSCGVKVPDSWKLRDDVTQASQYKRRIFRKFNHHAASDNPVIAKCGEPAPSGYDYAIEYIPKVNEYRVHVFDGRVIRVQKKRRITGFEGRDRRIRCESRGWCLCDVGTGTIDMDNHSGMIGLAVKAVAALGLDFGAVDIVQHKHTREFYVLEVNTAPGLNEAGVAVYADAIVEWDRQN